MSAYRLDAELCFLRYNFSVKREKGLKADYQGATPEQVAAAMLKHRPGTGLPSTSFSKSEFREVARHAIRSGIRSFHRRASPEDGDIEFVDEQVDSVVGEGPDAQDPDERSHNLDIGTESPK